jgi:hypothetical protein
MGLEKSIWELLKEVKKGNEESAGLDQSISATSTRMYDMRHDILTKAIAVDFQNIGNFFIQAAEQKIDTTMEIPVVRDLADTSFLNARFSVYNGKFLVSAHTHKGTDNIYQYDPKEGGQFCGLIEGDLPENLADDEYYRVVEELVDDWANIHKQVENEMTSRLNARIQELSVGIPEKNNELKALQTKETTIRKQHEALELG